jgi:hypothetical protein
VLTLTLPGTLTPVINCNHTNTDVNTKHFIYVVNLVVSVSVGVNTYFKITHWVSTGWITQCVKVQSVS